MRKLIQKLFDSDLSSLQISKETGVPQSTIHRMRKNERSLDNMSLKNAELLYNFAIDIFSNEANKRQNLLIKRASIIGMLQNLELTSEERHELENELNDIELKLKKNK
ncbi:DNA-binding protein [Staphylococcus phage vB_SauS_phi2]|uniref:DNA-binding protein n=1 Tax=Staphylococcus phage vB_SauS_phi2 TaxID=1674930 RepID=A0A0K1LL29_9CAUD|nr:DNA-binding protein [Staphylococcus phage vB_SauS_phi2]AKU42958.1 DNA-binding protein [Staphylococcus phage vB_SauS_phi2]